ncbi:carboxymuconolactone decarboxylase family protein [Chloroflexota bacterium]
MARISYVGKERAPKEIAEIFQKMETRGARVNNLWRTAAHAPATLLHFIRMGNALLSKTRLDPCLRELAILRVAAILDCEYERRSHVILGRDVGITEAKLKAVSDWTNSDVFNEIERVMLGFTDEVAQNARVDDKTFSRLSEHLDEGMMVELAETIGFYGMIARVLLPFQVDLDTEEPTSSNIIGRD